MSMSQPMLPLALVGVVLTLLVAGLIRLVARLDAAELTLRGLVGGVRAVRLAARGLAGLAGEVGRDVAAGEAAIGQLETLKRNGAGRPAPAGNVGTGPVSLPLRPAPGPRPPSPRSPGAVPPE